MVMSGFLCMVAIVIVYFLLLNYKKVKESTNSLNANGGQNGIAVSSFQRADVKFLMTRFTVVCFFVMHDMGSCLHDRS